MQALAHPVQALEFVSSGRHSGLGCHMQHGGHGVGVVGGKLRIDAVGQAKELACLGQIAGIGGLFAGVDGKGR